MSGRKPLAALRAVRAELLTATAFIVGWASITIAVSRIVPGAADVVWFTSVGLLAFSLGGWKLAITVVREGLYSLTRGRNG